MRTIYYHSMNYEAVQDGEALEFAKGLNNRDLYISNDYVILAARVLVKQKQLPIFQVVYEEEDITIIVEPDGSMQDQPNGVIDYFFKELFGF